VKPVFEWSEDKAKANLAKHGVSFEEARTVLFDRLSVTLADPDHSSDEERFLDIGCSSRQRILVVAYVDRGSTIRIINCRKATRSERRQYEEGQH
jgi:uncharacterized DUF497 family protein